MCVAQEFIGGAVKLVRHGLGRHVDHAPRKTAVFSAITIGLDAELTYEILAGRKCNHVAVHDSERDTVEIGGALIRRAAANLVVSCCEHVLPGYTCLLYTSDA